MAQIYFLNNHSPGKVEWSGLLVYRITRGGLKNLKSIQLETVGIYPMDYGTSTFTSFVGGEDWIKAFEVYPEIDPHDPQPGYYIGKIHSHNTMGVFHSQVDMDDLRENASKLPMFLSLIVNYACDAHCLLAIAAETKVVTKTSWRLKFENKYRTETKVHSPDKLLLIECNTGLSVDSWLLEQGNYLLTCRSTPQSPVDGWSSSRPNEVYTRTLSMLGSLLLLGTTKGRPASAYMSLTKVNALIDVSDRSKYIKAFKLYFPVWYKENFKDLTDCTIPIAIEGVQRFLGFHKDLWLTNHLTTALDDIINEPKPQVNYAYPEY